MGGLAVAGQWYGQSIVRKMNVMTMYVKNIHGIVCVFFNILAYFLCILYVFFFKSLSHLFKNNF